jgi:lysophospholipase L1-like esterase
MTSIASSLRFLSITFLTLLFFDFFFTDALLKYFDPKKSEKFYRVSHSIYHHDLKPNVSIKGIWRSGGYDVCTNEFGFKTYCNNFKSKKPKNIVFIGDSFTEGIGLSYEDTFVGLIDNKLHDVNISNMGVSSYSSSIYLTKVKYWINKGLKVDEVVVYVDVSDVQDEAVSYRIDDAKVINRVKEVITLKESVSNNLRWAFPFLHKFIYESKRYLVDGERDPSSGSVPNIFPNRSAWTYDNNASEYGDIGIEEGINLNKKNMLELYLFLKEKNIPLSVGVYPWPAQIKYDLSDSRHVRIWKEFCELKCKKFYNNFSDFNSLKNTLSSNELIDMYYIKNDIHFNELGNKVIADNFLRNMK